MKFLYKYSLLIVFILMLNACQKKTDALKPLEDNLLFSFAKELVIPINEGIAGFPIFDLSAISEELVYIGVFNEPVVVLNGKITNEDALLWSWNSSVSDKTQITYQDGIIENAQFAFTNLACLDKTELYWAAWTWETTGQTINQSTPLFSLQLAENYGAFLEYIDFQIIADENKDGFINAGENITLNVALFNSSEEAIEDGLLTVFYKDNIILEERQFTIPTTKDIAGLPINFTIPEGINFGETIPLVIQFKYNQCQVQNQRIQLTISGLEVCLATITLNSINYLPDLIWWDPLLLPINWDPDTYFILEQEDTANLYRSLTLNDRDIQQLPQSWPAISPCQPLSLNKVYSVTVFDEDFFDGDDFIGEITFKPSDYLEEQPATVSFSNPQINMEIELTWQ